MSGHKIKGLGNPVDFADAVNKEYITSRLQTITNLLNEFNNRIYNLEKKIEKTIKNETANSSKL